MSLRKSAGLMLLIVALCGLSACDSRRQERELTVVGWGGSSQRAHRDAYWTSFVVHTGVALREDVWHGGIGVLRTKVQGGANDWDVVQVEVEELLLGCEEGLFEPIDWQMLGGREQYLDIATNECGVGAMVWSQLFGYDAARMPQGPRNWAEFWDVKRFPGRRGPASHAEVHTRIRLDGGRCRARGRLQGAADAGGRRPRVSQAR